MEEEIEENQAKPLSRGQRLRDRNQKGKKPSKNGELAGEQPQKRMKIDH